MSKALFFTGQVLKNNRNLLQEENARQRLAMQQEMLELRKQEAADRRKNARKNNLDKSSVDSDFSGVSDPRLKLAISNRTREFNKFVGDNYDNQDPEVQAKINEMKDNLKLFVDYAGGLDTKLALYNPLNEDAASLRYQTDEEGNNMIDINRDNIFQEINDGTFDLQSRIASFSNDFDGQVIVDETTPGYIGDLEDMESVSFIGADGNSYSGLNPGDKTQFLNTFEKNHLINPNTKNFVSTQAEKDYMTNERFEIGGNVYDGIGAYLLEKEGIKDDPRPEERERFNPKSEFFDEKLHTDYVKYLGEKIWSRETANRNTLLTRKAKEEEIEGLTQEEINTLLAPPSQTKEYGLSNIRFDSGQYENLIDQNIQVSLSPESLIKEQGEGKLNQFNDLYQIHNFGKTGDANNTEVPAFGNVLYTSTLTSTGEPVAAVEFSGQQFLIPLVTAESSIKKSIKTADGLTMKLLKLSNIKTDNDWKTSWKK